MIKKAAGDPMRKQISDFSKTERGVTAIIGSGGKTTLMYTLAKELRHKGTVVLCTSTHILIPKQYEVVTGGIKEIGDALDEYGAVCAGTISEDPRKLTAPAVSFEELEALADYVLVEADGAKGLPLKAHTSHEPVIPGNSRQVILVAGADGLGRRIKEVCHRPGIWAELARTDPDGIVTPEGEAKVIMSEGLGNMVYINKADTLSEIAPAKRLAELISYPTVIGSLRQEEYEIWR